jgi:hypothetical protein
MLKLYRDPKSPYWYIRGTIAGRRICQSTKTTDRGQAEAYRRKRDAELFSTLSLGEGRPATWSEAVTVGEQEADEEEMIKDDLDRIRKWADDRLSTNQEPPWAWFQLMKLREVVDDTLEALNATTTTHSAGPVLAVDNDSQSDVVLPL